MDKYDMDKPATWFIGLFRFLKAQEVYVAVHGHDHPDVAASYNNIGNVYKRQGRQQEALDYYLRGLQILQEVHGDDHLDVAAAKFNIADVFERQGKLENAKSLFLECETIFAKVFGAEHGKAQDARRRAATVGEQRDGEVDHETSVAAHRRAAAVGEHEPSQDKDGEDGDDAAGLTHGMANLQVEDSRAWREASQEVLQSRKIVRARRRLHANVDDDTGLLHGMANLQV